MSDNIESKLKRLKEPLDEEALEWRVQRSGVKTKDNKEYPWILVVPYLKKIAIQDLLDEIIGPSGWRNEYQPGPDGGVICGIFIKIDGEWVGKWDGAPNTEFEKVKGGLSDSFKRASTCWGIGRYLYHCKEQFADINDNGVHYEEIKEKGTRKVLARVHWDNPKLIKPTTKSKSTKKKVEPPKEEASHPLGDPVTDFHKGIGKCKNLTQLKDWWTKEGYGLTQLMDKDSSDKATIMKDEMKEAFLNNK
jgi:hypothetical protein